MVYKLLGFLDTTVVNSSFQHHFSTAIWHFDHSFHFHSDFELTKCLYTMVYKQKHTVDIVYNGIQTGGLGLPFLDNCCHFSSKIW